MSVTATQKPEAPETRRAAPLPVTRIRASGPLVSVDLRELWARRELLYFLVWRDLKARYKQTMFGAAWALIQPLVTMIVFSIFFGRIARLQSDGLPYPIFAYSGLLPWQLFASAVGNASNSLIANQHLITKVYFPRLIVPMASVLTGSVDFCIAFCVLLGMMAWYGITPSLAIVVLPLFVALALVSALSVGLWISALNVRYRDAAHGVGFLIQVWFYGTPVVYSSQLVPEAWRPVYALNPMFGVLEGFRWALLGKTPAPAGQIAVSVLLVLLLLAGGVCYFQRTQKTFADVV